MKIAYFDCIAGASGDMILGALLDAGLPEPTLRQQLDLLRLDNYDLKCYSVLKKGFRATKVDVVVSDDAPARHLHHIQAIIQESGLSDTIKERANAIILRLGKVEAGIHGTTLEKVHLHELGGIDTIVDIVGALVGLEALGIEHIVASPLPLGRGFVEGAHGKIPLPAPATAALLKGVPIVGSEVDVETVTPTGAVLLTSLASEFGPIPPMTMTGLGYGAGGRDLVVPNILRVFLGHQARPDEVNTEMLTMLETNIDDLNPEVYEYVMDRLFAGEALDVYLSPVQMKKNRPGTLLSVLCRPDVADKLITILLKETSTLGVRQYRITRHALKRSVKTVETPFGPVRVKLAYQGGGWSKAAPEYEDCRKLAEASGVPLRDVYRAAEQSAGNL